jgi:hypothetical protein
VSENNEIKVVIKRKKNKTMVRTIYILLCFPSLDGSIATIEIRISAQRKNTKIKGLIFIIDIL